MAVARRTRGASKAGSSAAATPERQLAAFIAKFDPGNQRVIRAARKALRRRFATGYELVYDNYNFLVVGYSPTGRPSDTIVSMAAAANGVGLYFLHGADLPDPKQILLGSGRQTRFIRLASAGVLARPDVEALLKAAIARSKTPLPLSGRLQLVIRSVSAKQRPRRRQE